MKQRNKARSEELHILELIDDNQPYQIWKSKQDKQYLIFGKHVVPNQYLGVLGYELIGCSTEKKARELVSDFVQGRLIPPVRLKHTEARLAEVAKVLAVENA